MAYELVIQTGKNKYIKPAVVDGVTWDTELRDVPGKLTFSVYADKALKFSEGNPVRFKSGKKNIFYGFVFTKKDNKDNTVQVTAYDQIRYLKNKDTYIFRNKTASEIIKMLAKDYGLNLGTITDTKMKIKSLVEDNKTLLDMVMEALDLTLDKKAILYVLYDNFGKLTLKKAGSGNMKLKTLINHDTAESYEYESSIDSDTYNRIKLVYENKEKKTRDVYMEKSGKSINNWGLLQYYEKLNDPANGKAKAKAMLKLKNRVTKSLSVKGAFGDIAVRAGVSIPVALKMSDITQEGYLLVEKVSHKFNKDNHTMDITLKGGKYFV
jgi:hypothetical protein